MMKSDDKFKTLSRSPISVLESTRKDFEALLGSANSSSEEKTEKKQKQANQSRRQRLKKQEKHRNSVKAHVELHEFPSGRHTSKESAQHGLEEVQSSYTNPNFWYEDEQQHDPSSSSSSLSSKKSENLRKVKYHGSSPIIVQSSLVEVAANAESLFSTDVGSGDEHNEKILNVTPAGLQPRTSVSSSMSVKNYAKGKSHKNRQTLQKSPDESPCSSPDHHLTEVSSNCEPTAESLSPVHSVLKVVVHQCERLILDQPKSQMLVVVHAVSCETGRYILNNKAPVPPQFTGPWIHHSFNSNSIPEWNQEMIFELDADKYLSEIIFLFELVNEPNTNISSLIAWGFLRPVSRLGIKHLNKKVQLQLYKVPFRRLFRTPSRPNISDLFSWFNSEQKDKYPATLRITLVLSSKSSNFSTMKTENRFNVASPLRSGRLSGQAFKLPTRRSFTYEASAGALIACYRSEGSSLAIALTNGDIMIYQNSAISLHLKGHQGNVYDLQWNMSNGGDGWRLLSCGSDCTARVWNDTNDIILPHPAYVYSARFGDSDRIVTGCFDQMIRLWEFNSLFPQLIGTYAQHAAPINSLCWDSHGRLFSADAIGSICVWNSDHSGLQFERILNESSDEYRNQTPINCLIFHPSGSRLLVHYRGNKICLVEPKSGLHLVSYTGIYNPRLRLTSSISPCGGFVVSGSEDGSVHWFDLERGDLIAVATLPMSKSHPIMAVAFHPSDHIIAVCSLNSESCLSLLEFNKADSKTQGFSMITFPRTVQTAISPIENIFRRNSLTQSTNCTPTLDKLEKIFRKLDLVMAWSESHKSSLENEDHI